jgi:hypothetical protein
MFKRKFILMDDAPGAAGGGAPPAPGGEPPAAPAAPAADPTSILAAGKPPEPAPNEWIPEKFRVLNGEALDVEASAKKLAESYAGLEKRVGSGDVPPKTSDEYAVTVPEQFKEVWAEDDRFKAFRTAAHAEGFTQKQFDFAVGKYFEMVPDLVGGAAELDQTAAVEELRKTWKTDAEYSANVKDAYKAFAQFADPQDLAKMNEIGNNPVVLRMLAKIGKELGEGPGIPNDAGSTAADDIQTVLRSDAYLNAKHPDHKATSAKVQAYYAKKHGTAAAA